MIAFLIVIACIALLWWCCRGSYDGGDKRIKKPTFPPCPVAPPPPDKPVQKCLNCKNALYFTQTQDGLYCGLCKIEMDFAKDPDYVSDKEIDKLVKERWPEMSGVEELKHLGMLREKPRYITVEAVFGKKWIDNKEGWKL